jgi:hypothetical protein
MYKNTKRGKKKKSCLKKEINKKEKRSRRTKLVLDYHCLKPIAVI